MKKSTTISKIQRFVLKKSDRFEIICAEVMREFDNHNKSLKRLIKRALARRRMYYYEPRSLVRDVRRAIRWIAS